MKHQQIGVYPEIRQVIESFDTTVITEERKIELQPLIDFIQQKVANKSEVRLNFVCTHNSRRSHLSQIWAQTLASYFNINNVYCYSSGTEATALFPVVAETLTATGFNIKMLSEGNNPVYCIKYAPNKHPVIGFSKTIDDSFNPQSEFAAIMTCDSANEACPVIVGAEKRIPVMFADPKAFDNTPQQAEKYQERSLQIATELSYVFSKINQ